MAATNVHTLSPYEQARLDKIQRNQARLVSLGLLPNGKTNLNHRSTLGVGGGKRRLRRPTTTVHGRTNTPKKKQRPVRAAAAAATVVSPSPPQRPRSSRRLRYKSDPLVPPQPLLMNEDGDTGHNGRNVGKRETTKSDEMTTTKKVHHGFKCDIPMDVTSSPLTREEISRIEMTMDGNFLGHFEDYLTNIDIISDPNRRCVLRQITKLVSGEGITYSRWPTGCTFLPGIPVGPTDDILHLLSIGRVCEEKWGKDLGNGWLLSHPLRKLYMFQQYHLQPQLQ